MYKEGIKKRYIEEKEDSTNTPKGYLTRMFNRTESFEEKLAKDICCFTAYEIVDFYKTINFSSMESLVVLDNHLSLYVEWCLQQNLVPDCQNHFAEINNDTLLKCINTTTLSKSIISKELLDIWIDRLVNPSDAFVMLCLYEGIKGKSFCEIANLKISDFSGNKVKLCTGREMIVSDQLADLAEETDKTKDYYAVSFTNSKKYSLIDDGYIIKRFVNAREDISEFGRGRRIYNKLVRNFEFLGVEEYMRGNSLVESGKINYINRRCKELGMSGKDFLYSDYAKEVEDKYVYDIKRLRVPFYRKYEEYLV